MFTRIVMLQGKMEKLEDGIRTYREKVLPELRKQKGFKQAYFLINRQNGKVTGVSMWENEQGIKDTIPLTNRLVSTVSQTIGATEPATIEIYEVAVAEMPMAVGMK